MGLKTAEKILADGKGNEETLYKLALAAYEEAGQGKKELLENAQLVRIRQTENEIWTHA